jgi:predicted SprT family Zn-dependent metalloprotease
MEVTEEQIRYMFRNYNEKYFDNILPMPDIEITSSFKYFGLFTSEIENDTTVNPLIQISGQYDYKPAQIRDILIHEMIHYYLTYNGVEIDELHGKEFHRLAKMFNKQYGMHITATIDESKYKRRKGSSWLKYQFSKLF